MIYFVDFEASSLRSGSFPIEVAWVNEDGQGESYLIRPAEGWNPEWSPQSERTHGIALAALLEHGVPHARCQHGRAGADPAPGDRLL